MPKDKQPKELKVTDKRIFTADGDIREEFREDIHPVDPQRAAPAAAASAPQAPVAPAAPSSPDAGPTAPPQDRRQRQQGSPTGEERRRTLQEQLQNPETPFSNFVAGLVMQAYMSLGMLRDPYNPQGKVDAGAARQLIEIITMLRDKTKGNLTLQEEDFFEAALGELKLAFVQRTKSI